MAIGEIHPNARWSDTEGWYFQGDRPHYPATIAAKPEWLIPINAETKAAFDEAIRAASIVIAHK